MRNFLELTEAKGQIVFAFGRFNPPTTGHEKLITKTSQLSGSNPYRIYPSFSQNPKKDPLPHALKVGYMRKMFSKHARNIVADKDAKTAIHVAVKLYDEGFTDLVMVAGSDRVKEFSSLLKTYNGVEGKRHGFYKFNTIDVVSAGERDPDAEGVEGMSASKMRAAAVEGDFNSFQQGVPKGFKDAKKLYNDVRKYMGIREERHMGEMDEHEAVRDAYLTGRIWNVGDIVEAKGVSGKVIRKGTNYIAFHDEEGKVHKAWLHEIGLDEALPKNLYSFSPEKYDSDKFFGGKGTPAQRTQLLKLQNKALKAFASSPKQKEIKKEIDALRKKMGMKVKEEVELDERNYAKEYANYHGKPEQIARRSSRNKARRAMGNKVKTGMDVGHKDNDPLNNEPDNLRNEDPSKNRREPRLREQELSGAEKEKLKGYEKEIPKKDFIDKYGKEEGERIYYATITKMAKENAESLGEDAEDDKLARDMEAAQRKMQGAKQKKALKVRHKSQMDRAKTPVEKKSLGNRQNAERKAAADAIKRDIKSIRRTEEIEESPITGILRKVNQMTHPKQYDAIVKAYVKSRKDDPKKTTSFAVDKIVRQYSGIDVRSVIDYINKLIKKGVLPKDLAAEYHGEKMVREWYESETIREFYQEKYGDNWWEMFDEVHNRMVVKLGIGEDEFKPHMMYDPKTGKEYKADTYDDHIRMKKMGYVHKKPKMKENRTISFTNFRKLNDWREITEKAEHDGKSVDLNNPTKGDTKKYKVYVKNDKGNVVKVEFGDPNMEIKRDDPARRKNFRARHNCDNPGPKWKARYWSCKFWSTKSVTDLMKG